MVNKKNKGFTLVELLAVIAILGVIATIGIISVTRIINNNERKAFLEEGANLAAAAKYAYETNQLQGNACISLQNLYDLGYYAKGNTDNYKGSVYIAIDNNKMDITYWLTNNNLYIAEGKENSDADKVATSWSIQDNKVEICNGQNGTSESTPISTANPTGNPIDVTVNEPEAKEVKCQSCEVCPTCPSSGSGGANFVETEIKSANCNTSTINNKTTDKDQGAWAVRNETTIQTLNNDDVGVNGKCTLELPEPCKSNPSAANCANVKSKYFKGNNPNNYVRFVDDSSGTLFRIIGREYVRAWYYSDGNTNKYNWLTTANGNNYAYLYKLIQANYATDDQVVSHVNGDDDKGSFYDNYYGVFKSNEQNVKSFNGYGNINNSYYQSWFNIKGTNLSKYVENNLLMYKFQTDDTSFSNIRNGLDNSQTLRGNSLFNAIYFPNYQGKKIYSINGYYGILSLADIVNTSLVYEYDYNGTTLVEGRRCLDTHVRQVCRAYDIHVYLQNSTYASGITNNWITNLPGNELLLDNNSDNYEYALANEGEYIDGTSSFGEFRFKKVETQAKYEYGTSSTEYKAVNGFIRPTFYLKENVKFGVLIDDDTAGSATNPYIIYM